MLVFRIAITKQFLERSVVPVIVEKF